jgi:hypothetical protein
VISQYLLCCSCCCGFCSDGDDVRHIKCISLTSRRIHCNGSGSYCGNRMELSEEVYDDENLGDDDCFKQLDSISAVTYDG